MPLSQLHGQGCTQSTTFGAGPKIEEGTRFPMNTNPSEPGSFYSGLGRNDDSRRILLGQENKRSEPHCHLQGQYGAKNNILWHSVEYRRGRGIALCQAGCASRSET